MAGSGSNTKTDGEGAVFLIPPRRKVEIFGLVLMVLGLLLSLAFLSYHPEDVSVLRSAQLSEALLQPQNAPTEVPVQNLLGLLGAQLAQGLIPGFIGYGVLLLSSLLMVWGYVVFRRASPRRLLYPSVLTVLSAFVLACLMGWFDHTLEASLTAWAGTVGIGTAGWLQNVFGEVGSFILLFLSVAVMLLLVVDHDIQRTVDRGIEAVQAIVAGMAALGAYMRKQWSLTRAHSNTRPARAGDADASDEPESSVTPSSSAAESSPPEPRPADDVVEPPPTPPKTTAPDEPSEPDTEDRPVRRNDLFRSEADLTPPAADEKTDAPSRPEENESDSAAADPASSAPPPEETRNSSSSASDSPSPSSDERSTVETTDGDAPREELADDVSMTVQGQVEEETTDEINRSPETPEDFEYEPPSLDLLNESAHDDATIDREEHEKNKRILLDKLDMYNIEIEEINAVVGPTVTRYELTPAPGVKVSRIKSLEDDLAMAMAAPGVRMIAPIPGKSAVGVEIPNRNRELVRLRDVIGTTKFQDTDLELPLPLGKTIEGGVYLDDLTTMPHLLIAGATGSGKSVGLNALITGLIYACHPANLRFVIIDPKKIELQQYTPLETQFVAVPEDIDQTVITDVDEASGVLKSVEREMETRYDLLSDASVRDVTGYNEKFQAGELDPTEGHRHMPYLVVVVDELADLMMAAGDDVEGPISRLAQMARAVGIHLVLATQRPSVDVITGLIKANFSSRIAFEVASRVDSRTILDQGGAEDLVGNGDMLFLSGSDLRRLQGPFVSVEEVETVVEHVADQPGVTPYTLPSLQDAGHGPDETLGVEDTDDKFEEAARVIIRRQQGSVSLLQRKLAVGYTRAARIVDQLEEAGIVGPFNGTKAREVLVDDEEELDELLHGDDSEETEPDAENLS